MKTFAIKICPLCQEKLKLFFSGIERIYYCPAKNNSNGIPSLSTHYSVVCSGYNITQKTRLKDYLIESEKNLGTSKIYNVKCIRGTEINEDGTYTLHKTANVGITGSDFLKLDFLMEVPMITPEEPEKLIKKIKLLTPFI